MITLLDNIMTAMIVLIVAIPVGAVVALTLDALSPQRDEQ